MKSNEISDSFESIEGFRMCSSCGSGQIHENGDETPIVTCHNCKAKSCYSCKVSWHEGIKCKDFGKAKKNGGAMFNNGDDDKNQWGVFDIKNGSIAYKNNLNGVNIHTQASSGYYIPEGNINANNRPVFTSHQIGTKRSRQDQSCNDYSHEESYEPERKKGKKKVRLIKLIWFTMDIVQYLSSDLRRLITVIIFQLKFETGTGVDRMGKCDFHTNVLVSQGRESAKSNIGLFPYIAHPITYDTSLLGRHRGIQGHYNSCYLDSTLFAMFSFTR